MPTSLPPTARSLYAHGMSPAVSHDEAARMNVLSSLNAFVHRSLSAGVRLAYDRDVAPTLTDADKDLSDPRVRVGATVRAKIAKSPVYQHWASLRRNIQEMNRQNARHVALRQIDDLTARAQRFSGNAETLTLDPATEVPRYLAEADNHLQPGGYHAEVKPGDVIAGATYDLATFVTSAGGFGPKGDSGGRGISKWLKARFPEFKPKRILDLGSAHGNNTLPLAAAFPEAEVVALDAGGPVLRYGHARARAMGFNNVRFIQRAAEDIDASLGTFDWIQSTMFWHETSTRAIDVVMKRVFAALNTGGVFINLEQPNFTGTTPVFDRFMRNWDAWYNNEPFWARLHEMNMVEALQLAGFMRDKCFEGGVNPDVEPGHYPPWAGSVSRHDHEHATPVAGKTGYSGESWYLFGAWR
ncbi:MAG: class I SAM-dependent methyltransferase [Alphaproteobacteria bacterium]|nr:class I SAM-dependent methyltransferase [Alphaproteobacteria bacterium]